MLTDNHRQIADEIHKLLANRYSIDGREFRSRSGNGMDIMNWFLKYEIIYQFKRDSFSKGTNFSTYKNLDDLMSPPKEGKPSVKIEVTGGHVGGINTGDNLGEFTQSTNKSSNATTPYLTEKKPTTTIIETITKHTKEIVIGIIVFVIGTLIIYFLTGKV